MEPGSTGARALGCICDQISNSYGTGVGSPDIYGRKFIVSESCIVHGMSSWLAPKVNENIQYETHTALQIVLYTLPCRS